MELCDVCDCLILAGETWVHWHDGGRTWNMHERCWTIYREEVA